MTTNRQGEATSPSGDDWLSVIEVANRYNISRNTVTEWRRPRSKVKGPPWYMIGGRVLYKRSDLEAWEKAQFGGGEAA